VLNKFLLEVIEKKNTWDNSRREKRSSILGAMNFILGLTVFEIKKGE